MWKNVLGEYDRLQVLFQIKSNTDGLVKYLLKMAFLLEFERVENRIGSFENSFQFFKQSAWGSGVLRLS